MSHQLGSKAPFFSKLVYSYPSLKPLFKVRYSIPVCLLIGSYLHFNMQKFYNPEIPLIKLEHSQMQTQPDYANSALTFYRLRETDSSSD
jgi:hypothetical protein